MWHKWHRWHTWHTWHTWHIWHIQHIWQIDCLAITACHITQIIIDSWCIQTIAHIHMNESWRTPDTYNTYHTYNTYRQSRRAKTALAVAALLATPSRYARQNSHVHIYVWIYMYVFVYIPLCICMCLHTFFCNSCSFYDPEKVRIMNVVSVCIQKHWI